MSMIHHMILNNQFKGLFCIVFFKMTSLYIFKRALKYTRVLQSIALCWYFQKKYTVGEYYPLLSLQEKFMCFICGKRDFIFKKETCIWYDNVGKARKACEDCIDCVNTIEIKPEGEIVVELWICVVLKPLVLCEKSVCILCVRTSTKKWISVKLQEKRVFFAYKWEKK